MKFGKTIASAAILTAGIALSAELTAQNHNAEKVTRREQRSDTARAASASALTAQEKEGARTAKKQTAKEKRKAKLAAAKARKEAAKAKLNTAKADRDAAALQLSASGNVATDTGAEKVQRRQR